VRLDSVYFGTELHDLLAHGVTLRCRTGRTDAGWQLKTDNGCSTSRVWSWGWIHVLLGIIAVRAGAEPVSGAIWGQVRGSSGSSR